MATARTFLFCFFLSTLPLVSFSQVWELNFAMAQEKAQNDNKRVLLVFSGSDWCSPCMKLEKEIWQSTVFQEFAAKDLVLYRADFPQKKKNRLAESILNTNKELAERYNSKGYFPLVVLLDASGEVLGQMGYEKIGAKRYTQKIKALYP